MPIPASCFARRAWLVALLLTGALAGSTAAQPQPSTARAQTIAVRDLRFTLVPGAEGSATITVRRGAREVLRVTRASDMFDAERERDWVFLADANFDGYPDLWVLQAMGMVNMSYSLELFDPRSQSFSAVPEFEQLSTPTIDRRNRRITTFDRGGCCAHTEAIYRWRGTQLEMMAEWGDEAVPDDTGQTCFVRLWRRERRDGRMVDLADRFVPLHRFGGEAEPAPECRDARPPTSGAAR